MFVLIKKTVESSLQFLHFSVRGRSIWDIAWYYQNGYIKREFITTVGNSLIIQVSNLEDHYLTVGTKYNLVFSKGKVPGYLSLKLMFEEGSYVASWYRLEYMEKDILPSTWIALFGSKIPMVPFTGAEYEHTDFVEYESDYEDNDIDNLEYGLIEPDELDELYTELYTKKNKTVSFTDILAENNTEEPIRRTKKYTDE